MSNKRKNILELCSEDAHNSWTFWSSENKTETECAEIVQAINALVSEKMLVAFEHKADGSFVKVSYDAGRLEKEVRQSMISDSAPDTMYWFSATDQGKEEDRLMRSS
jgi:hypothetical protein